jgi:hypothetical protein
MPASEWTMSVLDSGNDRACDLHRLLYCCLGYFPAMKYIDSYTKIHRIPYCRRQNISSLIQPIPTPMPATI